MPKLKTVIQMYHDMVGFKEAYQKWRGHKQHRYIWYKVDWIMSNFTCKGVSAEEYFAYDFPHKNRVEKKDFVTCIPSVFIIRKMNYGSNRKLVEDKTIFKEVFKNFIKRESYSSEEFKNFEMFRDTLNRNNKMIIKPYNGYNGIGVHIVSSEEDMPSLKEEYNRLKQGKYVVEQVLENEGLLKKLNPQTLNTFRVNIINQSGKITWMNAILRSGQGGCVRTIFVPEAAFVL